MGRTIAGIYVIEFQKRGLSHAHILIFFAKDFKPHTVKDVNMIIVRLPNPKINKLAHETCIVSKCMMELHFHMPHAWKKANAKNNIHASSNPKQ
jgi:hypothetical protein